MLNITSEHLSSDDYFERKFQANISPSDQIFEKQEEELIEFKVKQHMESNMLSSEHIQNEVLNITSEHPSYENYFKSKFQAKIYPSDQKFDKQEE